MEVSKKRQKELFELIEGEFDSSSHLDYFNWDGYIQDEILSDEELTWLQENAEVVLIVQLKKE